MNDVTGLIKVLVPKVNSNGPTIVLGSDYYEVRDPGKVGLIVYLLHYLESRTVKAVVDIPDVLSGEYPYNMEIKNGARFSDATIKIIPLTSGLEPAKGDNFFIAI